MRPPIAWQQRNVPLTFTSITRSNDSSGYDSNGPTSSGGASGGESSAAALTRTCGMPHSRATSSVASSIAPRSVTSTRNRSASRSKTATRAPRSLRPRTISAPSCPAPPVTTATRPCRRTGLRARLLGLPDTVAELAYAAGTSRPRQHPVRERPHLRPGVGRDDGHADGAQALRVVDVIAHIGNSLQRHARRLCPLPHDGQLVVDALHTIDAQLLRASAHDRIRLRGDDQVPDADLVEAAQAKPVAAGEDEHLLTPLVHPDSVV